MTVSLDYLAYLPGGSPTCNKVSIHLNLLFGGFIHVFFAYLGGIHWGLIWITFRPCFVMYLALMPFPSILSRNI